MMDRIATLVLFLASAMMVWAALSEHQDAKHWREVEKSTRVGNLHCAICCQEIEGESCFGSEEVQRP